MKKDGNEYSTVGNMGNPGILSYLAMFYGGMLVLIGIVLIFIIVYIFQKCKCSSIVSHYNIFCIYIINLITN